MHGADEPDARGRIHLDRTGLGLDRNPRVVVTDVRLLASDWHVLRTTTIEFQHADGHWSTERRETYDRGNGATVLLYDPERRTVLLTRQFRYPAYVNGHPDGMLLEAAAGLLDDDDPDTAIRREAREETGFDIGAPQRIFDVFMSPGSVTEKLHFYAARYRAADRVSDGGGVAEEGEDIDVVELPFDDALQAIGRTIVDAKTIMLLQWAALSGPFASVTNRA
ncbi:NUDIX domain-containing protein [Diaminobutyricibacter sp. McL0608]|uniref:NUDIX domain-containing protein n=1 Tax=Leifsonia sp. McL0608 TaxID=3143537 RepID=UPI0031F2DA62